VAKIRDDYQLEEGAHYLLKRCSIEMLDGFMHLVPSSKTKPVRLWERGFTADAIPQQNASRTEYQLVDSFSNPSPQGAGDAQSGHIPAYG